jgi:hypothetical protein
MARQSHKNLSFEVPDHWQDQTVVAWAAPAQAGKPAQPNIVVTRDKLPPGQTIKTYATKQVAAISKSLPEFEIEDSRDINVAGLPAVEVRFTWEGESGHLAQRQIMVAHKDVVYNITATCLSSGVADNTPIFDKIIASLQFTSGSGT